MIPGPWVALVLTLGAYRVTRLLAWDDFPPLVKARNWATGAHRVGRRSANSAMGLTDEVPVDEIRHRRPILAALLRCAFCIGFWPSLAFYLAWRFEPGWTVTVAAPFALAAAVGLTARWLDP